MINYHQAAVAGVVSRDVDDAVGRGVNRRAVIGRYIHSRVERTLTAERVQSLAKAVRDVAQNGPNRRRVGGIGKTHGGQQVEAAAGNGDHRSVALQEGVLLDRAVKSV